MRGPARVVAHRRRRGDTHDGPVGVAVALRVVREENRVVGATDDPIARKVSRGNKVSVS